jgi:hypothetical protein
MADAWSHKIGKPLSIILTNPGNGPITSNSERLYSELVNQDFWGNGINFRTYDELLKPYAFSTNALNENRAESKITIESDENTLESKSINYENTNLVPEVEPFSKSITRKTNPRKNVVTRATTKKQASVKQCE